MNKNYSFTHNKQSYIVDWEEEDSILKLSFMDSYGIVLGVRKIPLLATIDQKQLDDIVRDYWKNFVKNKLMVDSK